MIAQRTGKNRRQREIMKSRQETQDKTEKTRAMKLNIYIYIKIKNKAGVGAQVEREEIYSSITISALGIFYIAIKLQKT